jgi:hypothetical protein
LLGHDRSIVDLIKDLVVTLWVKLRGMIEVARKRSGKLSLPRCFAGSGTKNDLSRAAVPAASLCKLDFV